MASTSNAESQMFMSTLITVSFASVEPSWKSVTKATGLRAVPLFFFDVSCWLLQ